MNELELKGKRAKKRLIFYQIYQVKKKIMHLGT